MQTPTTYAAAARHQSKNGEDLVHYLDKTGAIVYWASSDGTHYCKDCVTHDGISVSDLQNQQYSVFGIAISYRLRNILRGAYGFNRNNSTV